MVASDEWVLVGGLPAAAVRPGQICLMVASFDALFARVGESIK
jgi:hypothetical protein